MQETKMEAPDAGNWRAGNPLAANPRKPRPRSASPPKPTPSESPRREKWKSSAVGGPEKRFSAELAAQPRLETLPCRGGDAPAWETHNEFCFALKLDAPEDVQGGCCAVALRDDGVARETGYADGDAALGAAVVPLRMIFERGKAMAGTKTVHLTATWLPLGAAPNGARRARGEVLASFVFFFAEGLSRAAFETSARSRARSSADFSGASSARYVAMKRLQKAARSAEASLLQAGTPSEISSGHRALRDRLRDGLAALRERDSRHAGAGELWGELKALESPGDASAFFEELLGTRHTARAGGLASAVAGALARDVFPLAAARGAPEESSHLPVDVLVAPFTLVLARPRARGRRSVANCFAAVLDRAGQETRRCPGLGVGRGHGGGEERGTVEEAMAARAAFVLAVAPAAAPLASWVVESCKRHRDVLEPFCRAARALLQLRSDAQALGRADAAANAAFDPRLLARADGAYVEALDAAAPALARHAARCVEAETATAEALAWRDKAAALDLVEALATSDCTQAGRAALVLGPLVGACDRARHHGVKHVRNAAKRRLALEAARAAARREARGAASRRGVNALLGAKLPVSAVGLPRHDDAASVDYGWPRPATPPSPRRARPGGAPAPALGVSRLAEAPIPRAAARTLLYFAARAFSRSDVFPGPLLAWLAKDPRATCRAVRDDANQRVDLHHALRSLAVEPTQRGITASALLYALEDDSRRHEKVLVREAYAFGSDVEPPFP
ncbi:hypothetical protein JL721_6208 [Aureococcus anophagefferens]|nr:hypothetical protein JL721_6208 [Aureococcus anophagefferens]